MNIWRTLGSAAIGAGLLLFGMGYWPAMLIAVGVNLVARSIVSPRLEDQ